MTTLHPVSKSKHRAYQWTPFSSYSFCAKDQRAALVFDEIQNAARCAPVVFEQNGDHIEIVMLLGLHPGENVFVGSDGRWSGDYIPANYRSYPFCLADTNEGKSLLCFDADYEGISPVIQSAGAYYSFFTNDELSPKLAAVLDFLKTYHEKRKKSLLLSKQLQELGLLVPWQPEILGGMPVKLLRVDEKTLRRLNATTVKTLLENGMLGCIYSHLLSLDLVKRLEKLSQERSEDSQDDVVDWVSGESGDSGIDFDLLDF